MWAQENNFTNFYSQGFSIFSENAKNYRSSLSMMHRYFAGRSLIIKKKRIQKNHAN